LGMKVSNAEAIECTSLDKLLIVYADGHYTVITIPEKQYIQTQNGPPLWIGPADKETPLSVIYTDRKTHFPYVKRFIVKQFILDKIYQYLEPDMKLEFFSARPNPKIELHFKPKAKQRLATLKIDLKEFTIKNMSSKGQRIANKELKMIKLIKEQE
jgi:topoisomerase-4 subunit A